MVVELVVLRQGFAKHNYGGGGVGEGEGCARGRGAAPMRLPTIYRGGGGWFIALRPLGRWQRWGKEIPSFPFPTNCYPPFLGILILSLRDMILFLLRGILVRLDQGCGALPPLPTFMWVPPCRWAPLRNLLEPSRYNTEKSRTFSGGQNRTSHI